MKRSGWYAQWFAGYVTVALCWASCPAGNTQEVGPPGPKASASAEVVAAINSGRVLRNQGNYASAQEVFERVLKKARSSQDRAAEALALNNLASNYRYQAGLTSIIDQQSPPAELMKKSAELYEEAIRAAREAKDKSSEAYARLYLGVTWTGRNEYDKAFDQYTEALKLFQEVDDPLYIARTNMFMGETALHRLRQPELALKHFEAALPPYRTIKYWGDARYVIEQMDLAYERLMAQRVQP